MKKRFIIIIMITTILLIVTGVNAASLYAPDGTYLGEYNSNRYDPNSISNPYGRYGSQYAPNSINNPYGRYGSRYSQQSPNNPYVLPQQPFYGVRPFGR